MHCSPTPISATRADPTGFECGGFRRGDQHPFVPAKAGTQESEAVSFWVYISASRRIGAVPGFTKKYGIKMLVWFEQHETRESAFQRERQLKKWNRAWKLQLIERFNPSWKDLADELTP